MMRWWRRLAAALVTVAVVLGPPLVVLPWLFARWPRWPSARQWLTDPLNEHFVLAAALALGAALWLTVVVAVCAAATRRLRPLLRRLARAPLPTPAQATAGSMAGAALFAVPAAPVTDHAAGTTSPGDGIVPSAALHARPPVTAPPGVDVPGGGWVPQPAAEAIASIAGTWWVRRRRIYRPVVLDGRTSGAGPRRPLPQTVTAIQSAAGNQGGEPAVLVNADDLPRAGFALTGPGAADAARGLLVTTVLSRHGMAGGPRIIATRDVLTRLTPDGVIGPRAGLEVVPTAREVLGLLPPVPDSASWGRNGHRPGGPSAIVLLGAADVGNAAERFGVALRDAGAVSVVLGAAADLPTWTVAADGYVTGPDAGGARRLCVLGAQAAADLLVLASPPDRWVQDGSGDLVLPRPGRRTAPAGAPPGGQAIGRRRALTLTLLGGAALAHRGDPVRLRRSAALQVLALLAVQRDSTARDIVTALWPGLPSHTVTNRLYPTISELRRHLDTLTGHPVVERQGERYTLNSSVIAVDLWDFDTTVAQASTSLTAAERATACRAVVDAYRGELAAGQAWPWIAPAREEIRCDVLDAYITLSEASPAAEALTLLRAAMAVDPYNEQVHRRAVELLAEVGDHAAITPLLTAYTRRLAAAGLEPADDLAALAGRLTAARPLT